MVSYREQLPVSEEGLKFHGDRWILPKSVSDLIILGLSLCASALKQYWLVVAYWPNVLVVVRLIFEQCSVTRNVRTYFECCKLVTAPFGV